MFVFGRPWNLAIRGAAGTRSHVDVLLISSEKRPTGAGPRSLPRGSDRPGRVVPVDVLLGSGHTGPRTARSQLLHALRSLAIP
ncbi:hypothetical protein NDU88_007834 [Pleurodeles waltl]|uniref:Type II toxin-antitoxin system PemK/MazF family toxin n=1 Tax=Pleurodeles waltl TaxID=8319 RepID=A0AAV7QP48_PLEWA|nr:hypothetical protein NDU88_007834 [Pleurodeles waltl]